MDLLFPVLLIAIGLQIVKVREQRRRIELLGQHLAAYQIEKLMATLLDGYLRALGEQDAERREQVWSMLSTAETSLSDQIGRFAADLSGVWGEQALVSTLPVAVPLAHKWFPRSTFDLRRAVAIHAEGIAAAVRNDAGRSRRDKAFVVTAEILLFQHTCHWFCRSKTVANARMVARHQTHHAQLVDSVLPETREAYRRLARV